MRTRPPVSGWAWMLLAGMAVGSAPDAGAVGLEEDFVLPATTVLRPPPPQSAPVSDPAQPCRDPNQPGCTSGVIDRLNENVENVIEPIMEEEDGSQRACNAAPPASSAYRSRTQLCGSFFAQDRAECGQYGKLIYETVRKEFGPTSRFFANDITGMGNLCPKFDTFSEDRKAEFWVQVLGAMAAGESDCKPGTRARATNGWAVGLYQMNEPKSKRAWRGRWCDAQSVRGWKENTLCALTILHDQIKGSKHGGRYGGAGGVVQSKNTYWEVLKPSSRRHKAVTGPMLKAIPGCR